MKVSTTVIKTLLLSLVIAFSGHVFATPDFWFSGIANNNVFETNYVYGTCSDMSGVTVENDKLQIDLDTGTVYQLTPSDQQASANKRTCVVVDNALFTPTSVDDIDNSVVQNSQTALTVAYENSSTNYYAYITNNWVKLEGAIPSASGVNVTVVLDYSVSTQTNVTFAVGGSTLWYGDSSNTNFPIATSSRRLERIDLAGYGKLHSITSTVEIVADVSINPTEVTFGADFTNVTVTATVSSTADNTKYYLNWGARDPVEGTVDGGTVTFNVPIAAPSDAYESVNYTITAKVGNTQIASTENIPTKIADVRQWVTEDSENQHTTGSWSNDVAYAETGATVSDNTYTANNCSTGDLVTITFENITYAELGDLSVETPAGTQGAFALAENISDTVSTNFWVLTKPGEDYVWRRATCSGVAARLNVPYTVVMAFDYANNTYSVKVRDGTNSGDLTVDEATEFPICVTKTAVTDFVFKGNGTLTAIKGVESTGYMAKDAAGNYWVTILKAVTEGTGPFTILREHGDAAPSGWKFVTEGGIEKLVKAAVGMFFFAF